MIRSSDTINDLAAALVKAQAEMPGVPKATRGQVGNAVRYYADLATVVEVVQPVLAKHQLAYVQLPTGAEHGHVAVTTRLIHESGQWLESTLTMPGGNGGPQQVGSAITYARRYSLMAMLGLAPEDDDAAAAQQSHRPAPTKPTKPAAAPSEPAEGRPWMKRLMASFNAVGLVERGARLTYASTTIGRDIGSANDLTDEEASKLIGALQAMHATQQAEGAA